MFDPNSIPQQTADVPFTDAALFFLSRIRRTVCIRKRENAEVHEENWRDRKTIAAQPKIILSLQNPAHFVRACASGRTGTRGARRNHPLLIQNGVMIERKLRPSKILFSQAMGFVVLIALSWINELIDLRAHVLGNHPYISDFRESTLEMLFVLAVWLIVFGSTNRMLTRMQKLEGFLHLCSWCRRIGSKGRWLSTEEFFHRRFDTRTSHGICEECLKEQESAMTNAKRQLQLPTLENESTSRK